MPMAVSFLASVSHRRTAILWIFAADGAHYAIQDLVKSAWAAAEMLIQSADLQIAVFHPEKCCYGLHRSWRRAKYSTARQSVYIAPQIPASAQFRVIYLLREHLAKRLTVLQPDSPPAGNR